MLAKSRSCTVEPITKTNRGQNTTMKPTTINAQENMIDITTLPSESHILAEMTTEASNGTVDTTTVPTEMFSDMSTTGNDTLSGTEIILSGTKIILSRQKNGATVFYKGRSRMLGAFSTNPVCHDPFLSRDLHFHIVL